MITFSKLGKHGRFGNQLFQIASMIGFSKKYECELRHQPWDYDRFFQGKVSGLIVPTGSVFKDVLKEPHYHYTPEFWDQHAEDFRTKYVDIIGWLQSEKYWEHCVDEVKDTLSFNTSLRIGVMEKFVDALSRPTIAISIRRGDYVDNPNYELLPIEYYLKALYSYFNPDDFNIVIFSDDMKYCRIHFECFDNVYFADGTDVEQLCLMSMCDHFIIANSTFSWWGAYLGEKPYSKIIRPAYLFAGDLLKKSDSKDFYPERWKVYDHKTAPKFDLKDVTFTIPVSYDHQDRKFNLGLSVCMLQRFFDTNIIIGEQGGRKFEYFSQWCEYKSFSYPDFHRTKMLNEMAMATDAPIVVNWDADVFLPIAQIIKAVQLIRRNQADMVYPYDGRFARVPRTNFTRLEKYLDVGILQDPYKGTSPDDRKSVGGAIFFNKESFIVGGMENERMISYAPEDVERFERYTRLGYKVKRLNGIIFHMDHFRGPNSTIHHELYKKNEAELERLRRLDNSQLLAEVSQWPWAHAYTGDYYETITENAIRSRDAVFKVLQKEFKFMKDVRSVVDVGAGLGEWGFEIEKFGVEKYFAIDHRIPAGKLLIPAERFIDFDLKKDTDCRISALTNRKKVDMCICLEVMEHLPEEHAEKNIKRLTELADYILFSAAIPHQGGRNHVNEQWQTYWEKIFNRFGFYASEKPLVELLKGNDQVDVWYRQNMVLYSNKFEGRAFDYVDPEMYSNVVKTLKG